MRSKNMINETKNKNPKKLKQRLKMLVSLQLIYLLQVVAMSSKSSFANSCHLKSKFVFRKTNRWEFFDVKLARFAARIATPIENNRSTAAELVKGVLYLINTSNQIYRNFEPSKRIFF